MTTEEAIYILKNSAFLSTVSEYQEIEEAIGIAIEALEKQIPMPTRITTSTKRCGRCGRQLSGIGNIHHGRNYCTKCGQAIDWMIAYD